MAYKNLLFIKNCVFNNNTYYESCKPLILKTYG